MSLYYELEAISLKLLGFLDEKLRPHDPNYLANMIGGNSLLCILRYPEVQEGTEGVRAAAHEDVNPMTLLVAETTRELQVNMKDGRRIDVDNQPEVIVVNAADMLQMHMFGSFRSATHRVVNPATPDGSRYSIPFFVHPRGEVALVTAGDYLTHRLREIGVL